jgi:predicted kinase
MVSMQARGRAGPYIVVSGPAASGKTVLAGLLADELRWPLISKDTIKLALLPALQVTDVDVAREVGRAAMTVLLAVASEMRGGVVLEAVWRHDQGRDDLTTLSGPVVEIFCRCDRPTLEARYKARPRPTGYVPEHRDPSELWSGETLEPVALGWPVIEVDTTHEVDRVALVSAIRRALDLSAS